MAKKVNHTNTKCCICGSSESYIKYIDSNTKKPVYLWYKRYETDGSWLDNAYMCNKCWRRTSPNSFNNIQKSLRNHRINNLDSMSNSWKGDRYQKLACEQFGWEDLNKKNDSYNSPLDCYNPKTGLFHQVRGRISYYGTWNFTRLENEWYKKFKTMVVYCADKNGNYIERIYIFPLEEIINRRTISIYKNPTDARGNPIVTWYEKYRFKNEDGLKMANNIWKEKCYE